MSTSSFKQLLKQMAPDFGYLKEDFSLDKIMNGQRAPDSVEAKNKEQSEIEKNVLNQLDRSTKLDEVDTVTFGLETDDKKIVKVYVSAEQADEFEKELSNKLGEIDDIEEVLNELSKKFEIVDVEWPDEEKEEDPETEGEPDGSESLDPKVYKKDQTTKEPTVDLGEGLTYGERVGSELTEAMSSIEQRLTTPAQLLVYHAILQLGLPEVVMTKSPYRSTIVSAIKQTALELSKDSPLKTALKAFVKKSVDKGHVHSTDKGEDKGEDKAHAGTHEKKPAVAKKSTEKTVEKPVEKSGLHEAVEDQDAAYWEDVKKILSHVSNNEQALKRLLESSAWKRLVARAELSLSSRFVGPAQRKLAALVAELPAADEVAEAISADELSTLLEGLFQFADPSPEKSFSKAVLDSSQFRQFMTSTKSTLTQKFNGQARTRMQQLQAWLNTRKEVLKKTVTEAVVNDEGEWEFENTDDGFTLTHGDHLTMTLDEENLERMSKGITNKRAVVVTDVDKNKYTFSPRGVIVKVMPTGTSKVCEMSAEDVTALTEAMVEAESGKKPEEKITESKTVTSDDIGKSVTYSGDLESYCTLKKIDKDKATIHVKNTDGTSYDLKVSVSDLSLGVK